MSITFYATVDSDSIRPYMPDVPWMLPASSWARKGLKSPKLPAHVTHTAADCGGFVATFRWGDYRYTPEQYNDWLASFNPAWAAMMDFCCEDEITSGKPGIVRERQQRTTEMAHLFWSEYKRAKWCWVPTIQGWTVEDYVRHAKELRPLIDEMADFYGPGSEFRVGIGTLCRRASVRMIREVAYAVAGELPKGTRLHLWGIKLGALQSRIALPQQVASVDSAAWNGRVHSRQRYDWEAERDARGMTQRRYAYDIALPKYLAKIEAALAQPKQRTLLDALL